MLFDALCFALSGFFMKFSDEAMDEKNNTAIAILTGLLCVLFTVLVSVTNGDAACIFLAILIGTFFAKKVDSVNHILSAIVLILILAYAGIPHFSLTCLAICTIAAYLDEKGNDAYDLKEEHKKINEDETLLDKFFKYRYTLKVVVLLFSLLGLLNIMLPSSPLIGWYFFEPITFIYFYLFDLSYEIVGLYFDRFHNIF